MSAADIIAKNLAALPHPDGNPRQLPGFQTQLLPEAMAEQVTQTAKDIGDAIVFLLESSGLQIVPAGQTPTAEPTDAPPIANVHCTYCDARVLQLNISNPNRVLTGHHFALADCPQR